MCSNHLHYAMKTITLLCYMINCTTPPPVCIITLITKMAKHSWRILLHFAIEQKFVMLQSLCLLSVMKLIFCDIKDGITPSSWSDELNGLHFVLFKTSGVSKDIQYHVWSYSFLWLQITRSNIKPHAKWAVKTGGCRWLLNLPQGFVWVCMG